MSIVQRVFGISPFKRVKEHTQKVHECVLLLDSLTEALLDEDYPKIEELHDLMSRTEHEADQIKDHIRDEIHKSFLLSVGKQELKEFIRMQDGVADAVEDYSVVLLLRKTKIPGELREDLLAFVKQVIKVSEHLLNIAKELATVSETAFVGKRAKDILKAIDQIGVEEWQADRFQRKFARHCYSIEDKLDPVTLAFIDKMCSTLSAVANSAERAAKYLRLVIGR